MTINEIAKRIKSKGKTENNFKGCLLSAEKKFITKVDPDFIRLKKEVKKLNDKEAIAKKEKEEKSKAASFGLSPKTYRELVKKGKDILMSFGGTGHTMGYGASLIVVEKPGFVISIDKRKYYARGFNFSPAHGYFEIKVSLNELKKIKMIGGIPTIIITKDKKTKIKKALWFVSEGNFSKFKIVRTTGFLTSDYHAKTFDQAVAYRNKAAIRLRIKRVKEGKSNLVDGLFVGIEDAKKVMCDPGINAFINRHNLNKEYGYSIGYLLSFNDNKEYIYRMLE